MYNFEKTSVIVTTYNHEKYIAECLESILDQKLIDTEIIVADDCSNDKNLNIINQYANKYKNIKVLTSDVNLGLNFNFKRAIKEVKTKYFAVCEGDDFWIDDYKLFKQYNLMENHPDYSMCFHNIINYKQQKKSYVFYTPQISYKPSLKPETASGGGISAI